MLATRRQWSLILPGGANGDGLPFRTSWKMLEPMDGVHDWTTLDAAFDTVRARQTADTACWLSSLDMPNWLGALGVVMHSFDRLKKEVAKLRMERDILKKAAAYFAKDSL
jgi:hypothetical protein